MGNRSFLYLAAQGSEDEEFEEIAEANNLLPTLWEVLLAQGAESQAIDHQRVFGDAGTNNISAPASEALTRLASLCEFICRDPRSAKVDGVRRYLDGVQQFLHQRVEHWQAQCNAPVVLSANLDELSWMSSDSPTQYIADTLKQFNNNWQALREAMSRDDFPVIEEMLGFNEWNMTYQEWRAWAVVFGLAGLAHPYFSNAEVTPYPTDFADYDADDDDFAGNNYLADGFERFKDNGKWGVRKCLDEGGEIVIAAEWDRVQPMTSSLTDGEHENNDATHVVIYRGGRCGLAAYAGEFASQIVLAPSVDKIWPFNSDANSNVNGELAVAVSAGKMGYLRRDGVWHIEPTWEEAFDFSHGYAVIAQDGLHGYIDAAGKAIVSPQFDRADTYTQFGVALVAKAAHFALLGTDGGFVQPLKYTNIEWSDEFNGWLLNLDQRWGLSHSNGATWMDPSWQALTALIKGRFMLAKRDDRWGVLDWQGQEILACIYDELRPRVPMSDASRASSQKSPLHLIARQKQHVGLIEHTGRVLVPLQFASVEHFATPPRSEGFVEQLTQYVRVTQSSGGKQKPLCGVWRIDEQRLVIPCEYNYVWLAKLGAGDRFGFVVVRANGKQQGLGILLSDGSVLIHPEFAWIGEKRRLNDKRAGEIFTKAIYTEWGSGRPVRAARLNTDEEVWLRPDGACFTHLELLAQEYADGKLASALQLAEYFRDNEAAQNYQLARLWMARACGAEPLPQGKQIGLLEAMIQYGWMLDHEIGGERDRQGARHWLELAYKHEGQRDIRVLRHLGQLLWQVEPIDKSRGCELFGIGSFLKDATCSYNLGLAYRDGFGVVKDATKALNLFRAAAENGMASAAFEAGMLCTGFAVADDTTAKQRTEWQQEAIRWLEQAANECEQLEKERAQELLKKLSAVVHANMTGK
jgi:hypothetical protein